MLKITFAILSLALLGSPAWAEVAPIEEILICVPPTNGTLNAEMPLLGSTGCIAFTLQGSRGYGQWFIPYTGQVMCIMGRWDPEGMLFEGDATEMLFGLDAPLQPTPTLQVLSTTVDAMGYQQVVTHTDWVIDFSEFRPVTNDGLIPGQFQDFCR